MDPDSWIWELPQPNERELCCIFNIFRRYMKFLLKAETTPEIDMRRGTCLSFLCQLSEDANSFFDEENDRIHWTTSMAQLYLDAARDDQLDWWHHTVYAHLLDAADFFGYPLDAESMSHLYPH